MIVLDTTVLVYAKGAEHAYRQPCREIVAAAADGRIEATTSVEAIQEFVHVRARRRGRSDGVALGAAYAELLSPLIEVGRADLDRGLTLYSNMEELGAFDAILASAAMARDCEALVSADTGFGAIEGLNHLLPDSEAVARLLGVE